MEVVDNSVTMENNSTTYQQYTVTPGTVNFGLDYELKITTLLSLRSCWSKTKKMWLAKNAAEGGCFDDVIMHRETENAKNTYLIQLKQERKQTVIEKDEFTSQFLKNKKKSNFYLVKYFESISKLALAINANKDVEDLQMKSRENSETPILNSNTQPSDTNTTIINLLQQNFDNTICIIFTNRGTTSNCEFLKEDNVNDEMLSHINTGGEIFQIDYEKIDLGLVKDSKNCNKRLFLFSKQLSVDKLDTAIEKELEEFIQPLKLNPSKLSEACQKVENYINDWSKGRIGGSYIITKTDILKVLTEFLLSPYMVEIKEFKCQSKFQLEMWKNLQSHYTTIFVDSSDFIEEFMKTYITTEVYNLLKNFKKNGILQKDADNIKRRLLKSVTNLDENNFSDLAYEYQWKNNELPLLVEVKDAAELENVINILKMSQNVYRVIVLNKSGTDISDKYISEGSLVTLCDLNENDQNIVLGCSVTLQGGRSAITLSECLTEDLFRFVRVKEMIQIFTGIFCIDNNLKQLPEFFILGSLQCAYLHGEVFQNVEKDKFVVRCDSMSSFQTFLRNNRLRIESGLISTFTETENFQSLGEPKIYIVNKEHHINKIYKSNVTTNVHFLVLQNDKIIRWEKSVGTNKNIVPFLIKPDHYTVSGLKQITYTTFHKESQIPKLITASPGMGKSVLMDYIALNAPKTVWILRINLSEHSEYYKSKEFKTFNSDPLRHLINLNNQILSKREKGNELGAAVFQKYLFSKKVLVLLDGFDEIPIDYKDEVTKMIESLNDFQYPLCVSTRPVFKNQLELILGTFAISINPFTRDNQIHYLTEYFSKRINSSQTSERINTQLLIQNFVENLLNLKNQSLSKRDEGFTGIPLQINLLAQVYEEDCRSFLKSQKFVNNHFDLLYLYQTFINKKSEIFCKQYGGNLDTVYYCHKKLQSLYSLKLLFAKEDLLALNVDDELKDISDSFRNSTHQLQKDGIIAIANRFNPTFVHRTFAEYLAAEWLAMNINGRYEDGIKIIIKKLFHSNFTMIRNFFDQFLARDCPLHMAIINYQTEKATNIIKINSDELSKTDKGGRTFLHLLAAWGVHHPIETKSEVDIYKTIQIAVKDDMVDILKLVPIEKIKGTSRDTVLGYTCLDYAIVTSSLYTADIICAKLENLNQRIFTVTQDVNYMERYIKFSYGSLSSVVIMYNIVKNLKYPPPLNSKDGSGKVVLHRAVINGDKESVEQILDSGEDINVTDNKNMTALHYALIVTLNDQPKILTLLLDRGANVAIPDVNGKTPLHYAVHYNQIQNLTLLLKHDKLHNSFGAGVLHSTDNNGCTVLHCAAEKGHTKILQLLINYGANVNAKENNGQTPLHWAAIENHIDTVNCLTENHADLEARDKLHRTPLILAGVDGRRDVIKFLISKGADLRAKDLKGLNVLHWAARNGHKKTVTFLISKETDPQATLIDTKDKEGQTALHWASRKGYTEIADLLITTNTKTVIDDVDEHGRTALHWAAVFGHTETAKFLTSLTSGANVEAKDIDGATSLHLASKCRHLDTVELLLSRGANVESVDAEHATVLQWASGGGNTDIIALLLQHGANIEAQDNKYARTPLTRAVVNNRIGAVNLLLAKGANIKATSIKGSTLLMWAAIQGYTPIAELLLSHGADIQVNDVHHMTALHWASHRGRTETVDLLLSHGANLEDVDNRNRTPLYCAALYGHVDTVKKLLSKGANRTTRTIEGLTPLDVALKNDYKQVVHILQQE